MLQQVQHLHHDDILLALFHPETILEGNLTGGKLPFSLYESYYEPGSEDADKGLQVDGWGQGRQLQVRFKELAFEVETGEAEMIGVDFVAKGGGNATAVADAAPAQSETKTAKGKGKAKDIDTSSDEVALSPEDDEREQILSNQNLARYLTSHSHCLTYKQSKRHQDASPTNQSHSKLPQHSARIILDESLPSAFDVQRSESCASP